MAGRPVARPLPLASPLGSLEPPRAARRALRRHRNRARPLSTAACHACWRATEPPSEPKRPPLAARTRKSTCALPARNSNWSPLALSALTTGPGWPRARRLWAGTGAPPQAAFASSLGPGGQPRRGREPLERWGPRARACGGAGMWGRVRGHVEAFCGCVGGWEQGALCACCGARGRLALAGHAQAEGLACPAQVACRGRLILGCPAASRPPRLLSGQRKRSRRLGAGRHSAPCLASAA